MSGLAPALAEKEQAVIVGGSETRGANSAVNKDALTIACQCSIYAVATLYLNSGKLINVNFATAETFGRDADNGIASCALTLADTAANIEDLPAILHGPTSV